MPDPTNPTTTPTPDNKPSKRRGKKGVATKPSNFEPAVFVEGPPVAGALVEPSQESPPSIPSTQSIPSTSPPPLTPEELALLTATDDQELEEARTLLKAKAKLSARQKALLKKAAASTQSAPPRDPAEFDPERVAKSLNAYWVNGDGSSYQMRDQSPGWLKIPEEKLVLALKRMGIPPWEIGGEGISRIAQTIMHVMERRTLDRAFEAIAGYKDGIHAIKGSQVLIRKGPILIDPVEGDFPTILQLIKGLLAFEEGTTSDDFLQCDLFHLWMSRAVENVYNSPGVRLNSQILILAGPHGCGKSRLQHMVISPLLGHRSADPSRYVFGETAFNSGWVGCEHLLIEDPRPSMKMLDRLQLAQHLKALSVNEDQSLHAKGVDEFGVCPEFVVSISINDDQDSLRILPPLTPDFEDKVMLFRVAKRPLPMPSRTPKERLAFQAAIRDELPAYLHFLLNRCSVPDDLLSERFGVKHYHEPTLKSVLWEDTPASEFLALIDCAAVETDRVGSSVNYRPFFESSATLTGEQALAEYPMKTAGAAATLIQRAITERKRLWVGNYQELQASLETSQHARVAKKIIDHNAVPKLLKRLAEDLPDRIANYRSNTIRVWFIMAPTPMPVESEEPSIA